ncbi:nucleoid-associated protein YgaU [Loktanella ponticola]|uniref:Nucleoid-associated protein YgaU n=1 Tax=Yoonia ponticola TaxID=1524255 RepID=A0A7W9EYP8_9RHOB|nr:LysM peptidoglycan-binding domain-containing protein [Yoonia ponticola]MBB5723038.1 nucleoid-associated protein YgaU [Yoonia ponticola]
MNSLGPKQRASVLPWVITAGAVTFAVGVMGTLYITKSQQRAQTEALSSIVAQLSDIQVSRAQTPDLLAITTPASDTAVVAMPTPVDEIPTTIPSASAALAAAAPTEEDLRSKEDKIAEAIAIANRNQLRMLTEGVVAGLYDVTAEPVDGERPRLALQSRNAATTAQALEGILAAAAESGQIDVPDAVNTSDGNIDPQTMLFDLVQRSLENGSPEEVAAARELQLRAFAASTAETQTVSGERFYTVESGDSLAYIALQFYGSTGQYPRIFEANRDKLASPEKVQIGQRLRIPNV